MTEQLPIIHKTNAVTVTTTSNSLLGRGLAAISQTELDTRYRKARDIYNQVTGYGRNHRFRVELLPTQEELANEPLLQQLQPFYNLMKQLAEASIVFQQLANQGYGKAYFPLSCMYQGGQGIIEHFEKADYYAQLAFDWCFTNTSLNDPEIWTDFGLVYYQQQDKEQAAFWYGKAAEQGYAEAQFALGYIIYPAGEEAIFWCRKAAEQGHAEAQYNLGQMYEDGFGVEQNDELAEFWCRKAAEQGCAEAQYNLGEMYDDGCGVEQNDEQVLFWYEQAAEQGDQLAQMKLGLAYAKGQGIAKDEVQAVAWFRKAAEQGDASTQKNLDRLCATLIRSKDHHSQPVLVNRFRVNNTQIDAILKLKSEYQAQLEDILVGQSDDWCVLANDFGYGFKVQLKELQSRYKHGKLQIVFDDAEALRFVLIHNETDLLAVATVLGRLLIFPVNELPVLAHGKSNKIMKFYIDDLANKRDGVSSMTVFSMQQSLKITSGKRFVTFRPADIQHYTSSLGGRGQLLPRGFQRVNALESV